MVYRKTIKIERDDRDEQKSIGDFGQPKKRREFMATPVYFYTMDAQMKTLIDRTVARYTEISNKEFYFIIAAADDSKQAMERTVEGFRGFTSCLNGATEKGIIYGTGAWNKGAIQASPAMKEAFEMGKAV